MGRLADLYYKSQTYFWTQWHFILLTLQTKLSRSPNWGEIRFLYRPCLFSVNSLNAFCYLQIVKSCVNTYANITWCRSKKGTVCWKSTMQFLKRMTAILINHVFSLPIRVATVLLIFRMLSSYCFQFCKFHISRPVVWKHKSDSFAAVVTTGLNRNHRPNPFNVCR